MTGMTIPIPILRGLSLSRSSASVLRVFLCSLFLYPVGFSASVYAQAGDGLSGLDRDATFFSSLEDIPLMPGLSELPGHGMVFDKPEGRIVEALALTEGLPHKDILVYYGGTLPQLGWGRVSDTRFFREGEVLEIGFTRVAEGEAVRFLIRPVL